MKTIVLASQKGGVGKSTLAAHLAVAAELIGDGPCVLIDTDPQASLSEWWNGRVAETPAFAHASLKELPEKLEALAKARFAYAILDTPPSVSDSIQAVAALSEHGIVAPAVVADRVDFAASMIDGRTVLEVDAKGRSASEIGELWLFVKARMNDKKKARKK